MIELFIKILLGISGGALIILAGRSQTAYSRRLKAKEIMSNGDVFKSILKTYALFVAGVLLIFSKLGPFGNYV